MFDLIYRFDPSARGTSPGPTTPAEAIKRLEQGNRQFANMMDVPVGTDGSPAARIIQVDADHIGLPTPDGKPPTQKPFAAILGCADARVPVEMIFNQACNDMFVVRVAGNVLGAECLGSLDYALAALAEGIKVVVVLGHSKCGAVTAAADAFIDPGKYLGLGSSHPLRAIIDRIFPAVRAAHWGLEQVYGQQVEKQPGYRDALIETTVALNAALTAAAIQSEFRGRLAPDREVVYGVYNLVTRRVKLSLEPDAKIDIRLASPPGVGEGFEGLAALVAGSSMVRELLG